MSRRNILVLGLGYSLRRWLERHGDGANVAATVRDAESAGAARALGATPIPFEPGPGALVAAAEAADALVVSIPPGKGADPGLVALEGLARGPRQIVYLSTIGVYGDHAGAWVDEATQLSPVSGRSGARMAAEAGWRTLAERLGARMDLLRLAGIYGPGRNALAQLAAGTARRLVKPGQVFNRIHVDDVARAVDAVLAGRGEGGALIVADDEPAPPQDVIAYAAELMGVAPPPLTPYDPALLSPMGRSFYEECKRASNARLKTLLGALDYPTYREGLAALRAQGEGR